MLRTAPNQRRCKDCAKLRQKVHYARWYDTMYPNRKKNPVKGDKCKYYVAKRDECLEYQKQYNIAHAADIKKRYEINRAKKKAREMGTPIMGVDVST